MAIKESLIDCYQNVLFFLKHETTQQMVDEAHDKFARDEWMIASYINCGSFSIDALHKIEEDEAYKIKFQKLLTSRRNGSKVVIKDLCNLSSLEYAGFCRHTRHFYEYHWDIKILNDAELAENILPTITKDQITEFIYTHPTT